jgi:DNA polymerase-3 subunit delta'
MASALADAVEGCADLDREAILPLAGGSVGQALAYAELDLAPLALESVALMRVGDTSNARRSKLAQTLSGKAAARRYSAYLELLPKLVGRHAREVTGAKRQRTLDAYAQVRDVTAFAPRHSLDPAATVFQLGTILASVAANGPGG